MVVIDGQSAIALRHYDPTVNELIVADETVDVQELVTEIERLRQRAVSEHESLWDEMIATHEDEA